jgi:hypothetical protein
MRAHTHNDENALRLCVEGIFRTGNMPAGTNSHENGDVPWWVADVAAADSGSTALFGGDIRPTGADWYADRRRSP